MCSQLPEELCSAPLVRCGCSHKTDSSGSNHVLQALTKEHLSGYMKLCLLFFSRCVFVFPLQDSDYFKMFVFQLLLSYTSYTLFKADAEISVKSLSFLLKLQFLNLKIVFLCMRGQFLCKLCLFKQWVCVYVFCYRIFNF